MAAKRRIFDTVLCGIFGALLFAAQVAAAPLPNIELVSFLIILLTLVLGWRALGAVAIFILLEGLLYGFGLWWVNYLYVWPLLVLTVRLLRRMQSPLGWAVVSGAFGLVFGLLCSLLYIVLSGFPVAVATWIAGIPFDLLHCVSNAVIMLVLYRPCRRALERLETAAGRGSSGWKGTGT